MPDLIILRKLLILVLSTCLIQGCSTSEKADDDKPVKPNILILLADDLGYRDLSCYGGQSNTPNLDQLAFNGARLTDFYAAAPNCSPSRTGLLTGRTPSIVGMYNYRPPGHPMHLQDEEITLAELLKNQGYQTAHFGKWHLGCLPDDPKLNHPQPHDQGFQYSLGTENNAIPSHLNPENFVRNGIKTGTIVGYSCQILADEAISWFENDYNKSNPFFLYIAFHEPHKKVASPPALVQKYSDYPQKDAEYLANVENMDSAAGRIIKFLETKDLAKNTFVLFSSDNGSYRQPSNGELRAVKSYLYDGGIRVPGIFRWDENIPASTTISAPAGFVDIFPTICEITSKKLPPGIHYDGTSILPLLRKEKFERKDPLCWFFYRTSPEIAMRIGDKMILGRDMDSIPRTHRFSSMDMEYIKNMGIREFELYNLRFDPEQKNNLFPSDEDSESYSILLDQKLLEIQQQGYYWDSLPAPAGTKRIKTDWVRYKLNR